MLSNLPNIIKEDSQLSNLLEKGRLSFDEGRGVILRDKAPFLRVDVENGDLFIITPDGDVPYVPRSKCTVSDIENLEKRPKQSNAIFAASQYRGKLIIRLPQALPWVTEDEKHSPVYERRVRMSTDCILFSTIKSTHTSTVQPYEATSFKKAMAFGITNAQAVTAMADMTLDELSPPMKFNMHNLMGGRNFNKYLTDVLKDIGSDVVKVLGLDKRRLEKIAVFNAKSMIERATSIATPENMFAKLIIQDEQGNGLKDPITFHKVKIENDKSVIVIGGPP